MMPLIKSKLSLFLVVVLLAFSQQRIFAQNGMHLDDKHSFLIPMLDNDVMKGHAYVYLLDNVSKDSNSFMIQVFDEYLHDVGEKKFNMESKFTFHSAIFNGSNIVAKFQRENNAVRYVFFDQNANITFDTCVNVKIRKNKKTLSEVTFKQTPMYSIPNQGILDYLNTESRNEDGNSIISVANNGAVWRYDQYNSMPTNIQLLNADYSYVVNSVYSYATKKHYNRTANPKNQFNNVTTSIQLMTPQGRKIAETRLYKNDSISIYPIAAEIQSNGIEVISQFTKRAHEFSKIKYGTCIHLLDFNGHVISEHFNEFTSTMVKDSLMKKYKLMVHSYLYIHKAIKLKNGDWLLAAEQLLRTQLRIHPFKNPYIIYNKKNICLMEVDDHADVVKMYVEPNKEDGVRVPIKYYRNPQAGATVVSAKDRTDISYFVKNDDPKSENISFVFTDWNYKTKKLSLGNLLFKNGDIKVDRFIVPFKTSNTKVGVFPARYGHVLVIKYDPSIGLFDFDNIKFNN